MEKKILVVTPRARINYNQVYPAVIRVLDLIKDEDASVRFLLDGVTSGTTGLVVETVNKIEASLMSRGYDVKYLMRPLDVMLHGKQAQKKWIEKHLPNVDAVLVFNTGFSEANEVEKTCRQKDIPLVTIPAKVARRQ